MSKEALKLALEALEEYCKHGAIFMPITVGVAIKEALAQPEQEPVAWMRKDGQRVTTASDRHNYPDYETRYSIPLYTIPPQRKPLTDEQREEIAKGWRGRNWTVGDIIDAVEAAHGIKENT